MTKVVAIANQKGGVGKTTSAVNIAAYLAVTETPTLLIDMDPQANATTGVGIDVGSYKKSIYDIIIADFFGVLDFYICVSYICAAIKNIYNIL